MQFAETQINNETVLYYNEETGLSVYLLERYNIRLPSDHPEHPEIQVPYRYFVVGDSLCALNTLSPQTIAEFSLCFLKKVAQSIPNNRDVLIRMYSPLLGGGACSAVHQQKTNQQYAALKKFSFQCDGDSFLEVLRFKSTTDDIPGLIPCIPSQTPTKEEMEEHLQQILQSQDQQTINTLRIHIMQELERRRKRELERRREQEETDRNGPRR